MTERAYCAWAADIAAGQHSLLLAADRATVTDLNRRARTDRFRGGLIDPHVDAIPLDTSDPRPAPSTVRLPADYVRDHVELGYASTVHRAQGVTADTAHLLAREGMNREALYVGLTRGRHANHVYAATDTSGPEAHVTPTAETGRQMLEAILRSPASESSATAALRRRQANHVRAQPRRPMAATAYGRDRSSKALHRAVPTTTDTRDVPMTCNARVRRANTTRPPRRLQRQSAKRDQ